MRGRDVLVTRPAPGLERTARHLLSLGHRPYPAPMLGIVPQPLRATPPSGLQAALATSAQALGPLAQAGLRDIPLLTVGDATAEQARSLGFTDVVSAAGDASDLAALCLDRLDPGSEPLLLACGASQGAALASRLREAGFRVVRRVAYAQAPATAWPEMAARFLVSAREGAALFLSGSAAHVFARLVPAASVPLLAGIDALGISTAALAPVAGLPWRRLRVAVRPTSEDVLDLL